MSENTEVSQEVAQEAQAEILTIQDLDTVRYIIELALQRNAFQPAELEGVGKAYNKLAAFLKFTTQQLQSSQPAAESEETVAEAEGE
jgi:hypothetical protein